MRYFKYLFLAGLALAATAVAPASSYAGWELLGEQSVGFRIDRDVIRVGRREGRYERLKMRVLRNDIMLLSARVVYGNGSADDIRIHERIREGTETRPFDLPGFRGRYIDRIELVYRSRPSFDGQAVVQVFGDSVRDDRRGRDDRYDDRGGRGDRHDGRRGDRYGDDRGRSHGRRSYEWVSLGKRKVGFARDHDTIDVGRSEGNFRKIKLLVTGNDIRLLDVKVVYGNGSIDHIPVRRHLRQNSETGPLDLRGRDRMIRRIEMTYERKLNFRGSAYVEVFGLQAD